MMVGSAIYVPTKDTSAALIIPFPIVAVAGWMGLADTNMMTMTLTMVLVAGIIFGVTFILSKFA